MRIYTNPQPGAKLRGQGKHERETEVLYCRQDSPRRDLGLYTRFVIDGESADTIPSASESLLYPQESLGGVTLLAVVRRSAPAFLSAPTVLVAFARLKDCFSRGLDRLNVVGRRSLTVAPLNENFEFNYFLETMQVPHILLRGLNRNEINVWEEGGEKDGSLLADKACVASGIS